MHVVLKHNIQCTPRVIHATHCNTKLDGNFISLAFQCTLQNINRICMFDPYGRDEFNLPQAIWIKNTIRDSTMLMLKNLCGSSENDTSITTKCGTKVIREVTPWPKRVKNCLLIMFRLWLVRNGSLKMNVSFKTWWEGSKVNLIQIVKLY